MTQRRVYQTIYPYFITTNTKCRIWFFENEKYALLLYRTVVKACKIKHYNLVSFCILPDHLHLLAQKNVSADYPRTLEKVRWECDDYDFSYVKSSAGAQRRLSSLHDYTISNLLQSIKGNFSREIHIGEFWQSRFNFRIVNTEKRLSSTIKYILFNYKKHNLPRKYSKYPYIYCNKQKINELFF